MSRKQLSRANIEALVADALAIEAEDAKAAGSIGYMARALTLATMPHRKKAEQEFTRQNGAFTLSIIAPSRVGLPYGSIPRLLTSWLTTEAVRTKDRRLVLGASMSEFMRQLDLSPTGGARGDITRLKDQMKRLFSSSISCTYEAGGVEAETGFRIASSHVLWWNPKQPEQVGLWDSEVVLTDEFFREVTAAPVPIDMRALRVLKQSPLALDVYCWLTYRMSYLKRPTVIPWAALQMQFGADYSRLRDFKAAFLGQLRAVAVVYPEARLSTDEDGLKLLPSPTHVAKLE